MAAEKSVQDVVAGAFSKVISALQRSTSVRSRPLLADGESSSIGRRGNCGSSDSDEADRVEMTRAEKKR